MSLARKCDRCGTFYDPWDDEDALNHIAVSKRSYLIDGNYTNAVINHLDLCPNCARFLRMWLEDNIRYEPRSLEDLQVYVPGRIVPKRKGDEQ